MANLKDIRRRIQSVKSTQKITNALKLVSAAKFARASHAVQASRPYHQALERLVYDVLEAGGEGLKSELLNEGSEEKSLIMLLGTDRGQCGALNANLFKKTRAFAQEKETQGVKIELFPCGKRSVLFAKKSGFGISEEAEKVLEKAQYFKAVELVDKLLFQFLSGGYDRVYLAYNCYRTALNQEPVILQLLPLVRPKIEGKGQNDLIFEPSLTELLGPLLMKKVCAEVFKSLLEGSASEHGARMTAMDSATKNAKEVIRKLSLQYNRARQAAITKELIEIVSGAEALN